MKYQELSNGSFLGFLRSVLVMFCVFEIAASAPSTTTLPKSKPTAIDLLGLPYPVMSHPFQLSSELYAASSTTSTKPTSNKPFPTGAWWTNLVLANGESAISTLPYSFKVKEGKLQVSYPFRVVTPQVIQTAFASQLIFGSMKKPFHHQVEDYDPLSVTVRFFNGNESMRTYLVRGSPYVTLKYEVMVPSIEPGEGMEITRFQKLEKEQYLDGKDVEFAYYMLTLSNGQTWLLYGSDPSLKLEAVVHPTTGKRHVKAVEAFSGILRVAVCLDPYVQPFLLESASIYPIGGSIGYEIVDENQMKLNFQWKTKSFTRSSASGSLLMLALPHHLDMLDINSSSTSVLEDVVYTCMKGRMKGILGKTWQLMEMLPKIDWHFQEEGLFGPEIQNLHLRNSHRHDDDNDDDSFGTISSRNDTRRKMVHAIVRNLAQDMQMFSSLSADVYSFGKQIAREARLLLIAERFDHTKQEEILNKMKKELVQWLEGTNSDHFVYDQTFGGLVTSAGLQDQNADFGNGYYNDHHFHYGYLTYALAVVRKFDPAFLEPHAKAIALILGDIGTPPSHTAAAHGEVWSSLNITTLFPIARHKDWFVGHSYASGLFPMEVGKSQESSSEAVNAYYGLALYSYLDHARDYHQFARLLLAQEIRSVKKYWHMYPNSLIYEPSFAKNAMVGVVGEMSVVYSTWFGSKAVYVHGINMIPFTPVTPLLLTDEYVSFQYELIRRDYQALPSTDIWKSAMCLDHAILDAPSAYEELRDTVDVYDTWNSASNSLYWIATRPSWNFHHIGHNHHSNSKSSSTKQENECFGFPACSTAGANGTALNCCWTLPGCCPSALGCCPKRKNEAIMKSPSACHGEHQCAILGLDCCNSFEGCCQSDPITGAVLGCCKNQPSVPTAGSNNPSNSTTSLVSPAPAGDKSTCYSQPTCAALNLDCCGTDAGCCQPDPISGARLDCCIDVKSSPAVARSSTNTCHGDAACAAAGLDCCATDAGCCQADPTTELKLLCCDQTSSSGPAATSSAIPSSNTKEKTAPPPAQKAETKEQLFGTCHHQPHCLTGGSNGTALDCCFTDKGCCPGLLCCVDTFPTSSPRNSKQTKQELRDDEDDALHQSMGVSFTRVFAYFLGGCLVFALCFCFAMFYRRRHYSPIERDMRSYYCAAIMVMFVMCFIYLMLHA